MNWETLYCPNQSCCYYGIPFYEGCLVKNGSTHGFPQALCKACGSSISLSFPNSVWECIPRRSASNIHQTRETVINFS